MFLTRSRFDDRLRSAELATLLLDAVLFALGLFPCGTAPGEEVFDLFFWRVDALVAVVGVSSRPDAACRIAIWVDVEGSSMFRSIWPSGPHCAMRFESGCGGDDRSRAVALNPEVDIAAPDPEDWLSSRRSVRLSRIGICLPLIPGSHASSTGSRA